MADFEIVRAQRSQAKLRLALTAPSGGGKTWSSLVMAKGLVESLIESGHLTGTRLSGRSARRPSCGLR